MAPPRFASSTVVAAGILASRAAGLVRDMVFSHFFGLGPYADVFRMAARMPNALQNMLGEGTLSASFIPVYARLVAEGRADEARRVAGAVLAGVVAVVAAAVLIGEITAPWWVALFAPGFDADRYDTTVDVVRVMLPMTGVLVVSAWALGILNSHRRFLLPYAAPVVWNGAIVAAMVVGGFALGLSPRDHVMMTAWGALAGALLQVGIQVPTVLRLVPGVRPTWAPHEPNVREVFRTAGPAVLGRGVVQLGSWFDQFLASFVPSAVAAIASAQMLYLLPISLFGMAVAAAELPEMAAERNDAVAVRVRDATRRVVYFVLPCAAAYAFFGGRVVGALLQRGAFTEGDTRFVWAVLAAYTVGLIPTTIARSLASACFALGDSKTPARAAAGRSVLAAVLAVALLLGSGPVPGMGWTIQLLPDDWTVGGHPPGAIGIALASGTASWFEWVWLRRAVVRAVGAVGLDARTWAAFVGVGGVAVGAAALVDRWTGAWPAWAAVVPICATFGLVWLAGTFAAGLPEAKGLVGRLRR